MNIPIMSKEKKKSRLVFIEHCVVLFAILFLFWTALSGKLDFKHLTIGAVTSLVVTWVTLPLLRLPSAEKAGYHMAFDFPVLKFLFYIPWLLWEILKANVQVALIILSPKMPIDPQMITFKKSMSNPIAHITLANSITLTPGTITVDVQDGLYTVHALTGDAVSALTPADGEGEMQKIVARLFQENDIEKRSE